MRKKVIHLIDDESIIHDIFQRILDKSEYKIMISENRSQAMENHSPDVDVTIIDLPPAKRGTAMMFQRP